MVKNCPLTGRASEPISCPCYYEQSCSEIRYYKGKYKVKVIIKAGRHFLVESLEPIPFDGWGTKDFPEFVASGTIRVGWKFTTVARLCWRKKNQ